MMQGVLARGTARSIANLVALCRRQDRHLGRRERRLVRRLHQRSHRRGLGRLRQCRRQAPHAWWRRDRRRRGGADLRAGHPGGVGQCRAQDGARAAVAGGQDDALVQVDRPRIRRDRQRPRIQRVLPRRRQGQDHRHPGPPDASQPPKPCAGDDDDRPRRRARVERYERPEPSYYYYSRGWSQGGWQSDYGRQQQRQDWGWRGWR